MVVGIGSMLLMIALASRAEIIGLIAVAGGSVLIICCRLEEEGGWALRYCKLNAM